MDVNQKLLDFFSALSDETRLKIIIAISHGPMSVNSIHKEIGEVTLSAISHQLKHLNSLGLVEYKKQGRKKFFVLSDDYCWCPLKDAMSQIGRKTRCPHCTGGLDGKN